MTMPDTANGMTPAKGMTAVIALSSAAALAYRRPVAQGSG
jgi:hypothetical protein